VIILARVTPRELPWLMPLERHGSPRLTSTANFARSLPKRRCNFCKSGA
jgi:hypothetical protein